MSTSRPYHHGDLRAALLEAAGSLLDSGGENAVSLREAARMAGVSPTAAYRHFTDKEALLATLAARGFAEFGQAMAAAVGRREATPLAARGRAYIRFALANPGRFRLMFGGLLNRAAAHPVLREAASEAFAALEATAGAQSRDQALRAWGLVHGLAHLLLDGAIGEADVEAMIDRLIT